MKGSSNNQRIVNIKTTISYNADPSGVLSRSPRKKLFSTKFEFTYNSLLLLNYFCMGTLLKGPGPF